LAQTPILVEVIHMAIPMVVVELQTHMATQIRTEMEVVDLIPMAMEAVDLIPMAMEAVDLIPMEMEAVELMDQVLTVMVDQALMVVVLDEEANLKSEVHQQNK